MKKYYVYFAATRAEWRYVICACLCLGIAGILYWQDILPLREMFITNELHEQNLWQQIQIIKKKEISYEKKMVPIPQTSILLDEWQQKLIKSNDMVRLFKEMIAICKRNQLNILLFQIEPALKENNFFKQPIQIMLVGNYVSIMHFVNQIAHLPWTVTVGNFSLKTILDNQNNLYSAQFKFYIYYHPNQSISRNTRR